MAIFKASDRIRNVAIFLRGGAGGRGRTKTGRLWCYAVDNRPWRGPGHPAAAYVYSEDRKADHPAIHLKDFRGLLQVDGYAGFGRLVKAASNDAPRLTCRG